MTLKSALRRRWRGEERRAAAIVEDLQNNKDWTRHLRAADDGTLPEFPWVDDCGRLALTTEAAPRDLRGITLRDIDLSGVEGLADAVLDYATFHNVRLDSASLNGCSLRGVTFRGGTSLNGMSAQFPSFEGVVCRNVSMSHAKLRNANLSGCDFRDSDLRSTSITDSSLAGCDLRDADLRDTLFERVKITEEGLFGFLSLQRSWTKFGGHWQMRREINQATSPRLRDYIEGCSQIQEKWRKRPFHAFIHYLFSNFGRSATRFGLSTLGGSWLFFALLYASFPLPRFLRGTDLGAALQRVPHPQFAVGGTIRPLTIADAMYFSATTITTLGYGDIVPAVTDSLARFLVGSEAIAGVVILGVFIDRLMRDAPRDWELESGRKDDASSTTRTAQGGAVVQ